MHEQQPKYMNFSAALNPLSKKMNRTVSECKELSTAAKETWKELEGKAGGCKTKKTAGPQTKEKGNMNKLPTSDTSHRRDTV